MPISSTTLPVIQYSGSGTTGPFNTVFIFVNAADLTVIKTSTTGVDSTLVLTTDYTVTGGGSGLASGAVTLTSALTSGQKLTIIRNTALTQEVDYVENDKFPAETHEGALNKLTLIAQELSRKVGYAITLPDSVLTTFSAEAPAPTATYVLRVNAAGTGLEWVGLSTLGAVTAGTGLDLTSSVLSLDAALGDLNDVDVTGAAKGSTLAYTGTEWVDLGVGTNGQVLKANSATATGLEWATSTGDVAGPASSVDNQLALFDLTTGKLLKAATTNGIAKLTTGVLSAASAGTDYYAPGSTDVAVADGGTGLSSATAYAVLCGGTTSTGAFQSIASVGTAGQVLTSNGAGALPTFQAGGGAYTLISTSTPSAVATLDLTLDFTTYKAHKVIISGMLPVTDLVQLFGRFSVDGGSTYLTQYYATSYGSNDAATALTVSNSGSPGAEIQIIDSGIAAIGNLSTEGIYYSEIDIYTSGNTSADRTYITFKNYYASPTSTGTITYGSGKAVSTTVADRFRLLFSSGNIASGTVYLYGLK